MIDPLGIDIHSPFMSWICEEGIYQTAFQIVATENGIEVWNSQKVASNEMHMSYGGNLTSRQQVKWQIRLWDENDVAGEWSDIASFEMGILNKEYFRAKWINPELNVNSERHLPASYLKKSFYKKGGKNARLYITCHGLYVAYINGRRVGDFVLAPGTGNYQKKLAYQTYDVSDYLVDGENEIQVILGDGWYRSCSGVVGDRNLYGTDVSLYCQLEVDGKIICVSDETWLASQSGPIRENDMQQGETCNANYEVIDDWHEVKIENFGIQNLVCSNSVPIKEWERFHGVIRVTPNGEKIIDFGQNIAGYVEFTVDAHKGDKITLYHGEALDENGNFTNQNFQPGDRHKEGGIQQKIEYVCKEGLNYYKPTFTIHGFQYAKIETEVNLENAVFIAYAVYSQMEETGYFTCSNDNINQLLQNCKWSQKSNFCDIPTDCPTRERAGWTGDAGVFVDAGIYLMDCYPVFRKWLSECRLTQNEDGRIHIIAPPNEKPSELSDMLSESVGWGDACIIVPYALYKRYDDIYILKENYEMMKKWFSFLIARAGKSKSGDQTEKSPYQKFTIDTGFDFGEWCEPEGMKSPMIGIATAYLSYSGKLLCEIARCLGKEEEAAYFLKISDNARKAYCYSYTNNGKIISEHQCEYVRALAFGLLNEEESHQAAADLNEMIIKNGYHLNTGFLSTPFLCEELARYGYLESAYRLLLQDTVPSWLYEVKKGANTIWETWEGIKEDGTVHASLNHYSYGVISEWFFSGICGIKVKNDSLTIEPKPHCLLKHAKAVYHSPIGRVESGWVSENGEFKYNFVIPSNVCAEVRLLDGRNFELTAGQYSF